MGAFHSTKIPVRNSEIPHVQWKGTFWSHRTEMTGSVKIDHLQGWSQIFRSDRTDPFDILPKFPKSFTEWKAPKVLKTIYSLHKRFPFCLLLYYFFHKIQNDTTKTCPCWQKSPVGQNLFRTSNLIGSCWPAGSSIVSELGFIVSFVWVRAIYCFLNQSCEPFLELPAHKITQ